MFERIRGMREDRDLTQGDLAAVLGVHQTTYSDYERGNLNIPAVSLIALAEFYSTSVDYLLGFTDQSAPYPRKKGK